MSKNKLIIDGYELFIHSDTDIENCNDIWNGMYFENLQLSSNDIVVDCGAYIGAFSLLSVKKGAKIVFAFEPEPDSYHLLIQNIHINNLEDIIKADNAALGLFDANIPLIIYNDIHKKQNSYIGSYGTLDQLTGKIKIIKMRGLYNIVEALPEINFLKLSVNGSEIACLSGLNETHWRKIKKAVIMTTRSNLLILEKLLFKQNYLKLMLTEDGCRIKIYIENKAV